MAAFRRKRSRARKLANMMSPSVAQVSVVEEERLEAGHMSKEMKSTSDDMRVQGALHATNVKLRHSFSRNTLGASLIMITTAVAATGQIG